MDNERKQDFLLQGQDQMDQRVVFCFSTLRLRSNKTISLTSFVFWGLVGLKVLTNFKSFQGLLTNVVFYPDPPPPLMLPGGGGWLKNGNHGLNCI